MTEETRSTRGRIESLKRPSFAPSSNKSSISSASSSSFVAISSPSSAPPVTGGRKASTTSIDTLNGTSYIRDFIKLLKDLEDKLARKVIDSRTLIDVCSLLKIYGAAIDTSTSSTYDRQKKEQKDQKEEESDEDDPSESKELLNRFFRHLKHLVKENQLDTVTKGHVLHVIELRKKKWLINNNQFDSVLPIAFSNGDDHSAPKEMTDRTCDQTAPKEGLTDYSNVNPRDYVSEDFLIRNCDTSKVMGFKGVRAKIIEEISQTCITFPRAKKRDVVRRIQITGPDASCIQKAKELIGEAIRRHSTPFEDAGGTALAAVTTVFCSALFKTSYHGWGNLFDDD